MAKYGPKASQLVEREMKEMKAGKLHSGSGEKVTNPKQAIAIALSEAGNSCGRKGSREGHRGEAQQSSEEYHREAEPG